MLLPTDITGLPRITDVLGGILLLYAAYGLGRFIYNIYFHPLAKFPGPKFRAASYIPDYWSVFKGTTARDGKALHEKYGDVVRLTPERLSFNTSQAWKDIYGLQHGKKQIPKDMKFYKQDRKNFDSIIVADDASHSRQRRNLAHAFSDSALRQQENLLTDYFELLVSRLKDQISDKPSATVDMVRWYNYTTFDIIGDLTFGESFHALENGEYHSWVAALFRLFKFGRFITIARGYPLTSFLLDLLVKLAPSFNKNREAHLGFTASKVEKRLAIESDRTDFMTYVLRHNDEKGMTRSEICDTFGLLVIAGSETTATLLSGATYLLAQNPEILKKLKDIVRNAFQNPEDITLTSTGQIAYLHAVLEESLRLYPPVPSLLPRRTVAPGEVIDGHFVPGNTSLGVHQSAANHAAKNFHNPEKFVPERWLPDPPVEYRNDNKEALQPFSAGPRNCLGKNLAYSEMRSILARMLFHFDWELLPESTNWMDQHDYLLWDKPPLMMKLSHRQM